MANRRHTAACVLLLATVALASCGPSEEPVMRASEGPGSETAIVESVTDGDTIRLEPDVRVRLVQVDAPETGDRAQCWGKEATAALRTRLRAGDEVTIERDPKLDDVDQHGRELRYVEADGELLNVWLVREGHALPYFFRNQRGTHADELLEAARDARSTKRGMWGACPGVELDPGIGI